MSRVFNFSAGPAVLPVEVLEQAQSEMLDWRSSGMSVMEMSHRGKDFMEIAQQAEADLRELLAVPSNYKILFLQGGASTQFALMPMNFVKPGSKAGYIITGSWSQKAVKEAGKWCQAVVVADSGSPNYSEVPTQDDLDLGNDLNYVHYTPNETIDGVEFPYIPETGDIPLIADYSSSILSEPIPVEKYGMIYAGAQKNIGCAGLVLVIIREDLLNAKINKLPSIFDYSVLAAADSMYNTPSTYAWYIAGLVFQWLKKLGGLQAMAARNKRKADKLYKAIDDSDFYQNPVSPTCRSRMNVPFTLANPDLDGLFLSEAAQNQLLSLKGHRSVGGMRASIYNAMPEQGVNALIDFMQQFASRNS